MLLERILSAKGFDVTAADEGEKGLELAQTEPFDLIFLDVMMPQVDGKQVCARLKASLSTASIPIIFVTTRRREPECMALGAVDSHHEAGDAGGRRGMSGQSAGC